MGVLQMLHVLQGKTNLTFPYMYTTPLLLLHIFYINKCNKCNSSKKGAWRYQEGRKSVTDRSVTKCNKV